MRIYGIPLFIAHNCKVLGNTDKEYNYSKDYAAKGILTA